MGCEHDCCAIIALLAPRLANAFDTRILAMCFVQHILICTISATKLLLLFYIVPSTLLCVCTSIVFIGVYLYAWHVNVCASLNSTFHDWDGTEDGK